MNDGPTPDDLRAKVFEDRATPGNWRVEKMNEDGGYDAVRVFTGRMREHKQSATPSRNLANMTKSSYPDILLLNPISP
jgi:hypothetical protein